MRSLPPSERASRGSVQGMAMDNRKAVLDLRRMAEADRLAVAGGIPAATLMQHAGQAVAHEVMRRWSRGSGSSGTENAVRPSAAHG